MCYVGFFLSMFVLSFGLGALCLMLGMSFYVVLLCAAVTGYVFGEYFVRFEE